MNVVKALRWKRVKGVMVTSLGLGEQRPWRGISRLVCVSAAISATSAATDRLEGGVARGRGPTDADPIISIASLIGGNLIDLRHYIRLFAARGSQIPSFLAAPSRHKRAALGGFEKGALGKQPTNRHAGCRLKRLGPCSGSRLLARYRPGSWRRRSNSAEF